MPLVFLCKIKLQMQFNGARAYACAPNYPHAHIASNFSCSKLPFDFFPGFPEICTRRLVIRLDKNQNLCYNIKKRLYCPATRFFYNDRKNTRNRNKRRTKRQINKALVHDLPLPRLDKRENFCYNIYIIKNGRKVI